MPRLTPTRALVALLVLMVALTGLWRLLRPRSTDPWACTQTLGPADNGVQAWLASAQPGQVLCLAPGLYTGSANMVQIPDTFAGTATQPITIRAAVEGTVLLDGEDQRRPLHTRGQYGVIWGLNVRRGDNMNVFLGGTGWQVQRLVAWDVGSHTDHNIGVGGTHNLLEDCAAFGTAEKALVAGTGNATRTGNVIRRCFAIQQDAGDSTSTTNTAEVGYGQSDVLFENNLLTYHRTGARSSPEGLFQFFRSQDSRVLGTITYVTAEATFDPSTLFFAATDGGSQQQQGSYQPTTGARVQHLLAFIAPGHPAFAERRALRFDYTSPGPAGSNNVASHLVGVSGMPLSCSSPSWSCSQVQHGQTLEAAIGAGKSVWLDSVAAPGICKRYVGGVLTEDPLWPWPMNQRITDAMQQAGTAPIDVTQTMEQLFGPIPDACRWDRTPVPPQPEPPQPGALVLTCTGTVSAVPGAAHLTCTQQLRR